MSDNFIAGLCVGACVVSLVGLIITIYTHRPYQVQMRTNYYKGPGPWKKVRRFRTIHQAVTWYKDYGSPYANAWVEYRVFDCANRQEIDTTTAIPVIQTGWGWGHGKKSWIMPNTKP